MIKEVINEWFSKELKDRFEIESQVDWVKNAQLSCGKGEEEAIEIITDMVMTRNFFSHYDPDKGPILNYFNRSVKLCSFRYVKNKDKEYNDHLRIIDNLASKNVSDRTEVKIMIKELLKEIKSYISEEVKLLELFEEIEENGCGFRTKDLFTENEDWNPKTKKYYLSKLRKKVNVKFGDVYAEIA